MDMIGNIPPFTCNCVVGKPNPVVYDGESFADCLRAGKDGGREYLVDAISREKLLSNVWGYDFYGDDRTVDTHIKMLRSSLGKYRDKIITLRGLGYKIEL